MGGGLSIRGGQGEAIVVKIGRAEFAVLDRALVTEVPDEGAKVQVQPYARRRFDGLRADTPEERTEYAADGTPYTVQTHVLGSAPAKLPLPQPRCPELQELINQLEQLPAPDGFRHITHLLVDAGARLGLCLDEGHFAFHIRTFFRHVNNLIDVDEAVELRRAALRHQQQQRNNAAK